MFVEREEEEKKKIFFKPREESSILLKGLSDFITPSLNMCTRFNIKKNFLCI